MPTLYAEVSLSAVSMILLEAAAHWSRLDLHVASHLVFNCSQTCALAEMELATKLMMTAVETKRIHILHATIR